MFCLRPRQTRAFERRLLCLRAADHGNSLTTAAAMTGRSRSTEAQQRASSRRSARASGPAETGRIHHTIQSKGV